MVQENLHAQRPSKNEAFIARIKQITHRVETLHQNFSPQLSGVFTEQCHQDIRVKINFLDRISLDEYVAYIDNQFSAQTYAFKMHPQNALALLAIETVLIPSLVGTAINKHTENPQIKTIVMHLLKDLVQPGEKASPCV